MEAAVAGGRPGLVLWAGFAFVGGAVVGGSGFWAFVAGEVAGAPEGGCWWTLRESAGGWCGIAWIGEICGFVWRDWSSCADFSTANAAIGGLVGNQLAVFGLLAEVRFL